MTTEINPKANSMGTVIIAASGATRRQSVAKRSEMTNTGNSTQTTIDSEEMTVETTQETTATTTVMIPVTDGETTAMRNHGTTRNWSVRYADTPDTPLRTATREQREHQHTEMSHTTSKTSERTMNSEGNSNDPEITQQMKCLPNPSRKKNN